MEDLIRSVNKNTAGIFSRAPVLIIILPEEIASCIHSRDIYLSEFVIAKIKGKIVGYEGHPLITDQVLMKVPLNLLHPLKILEDIRKNTEGNICSLTLIHFTRWWWKWSVSSQDLPK